MIMKQIIPFKKELPFKTKVSEITSISLERDIEVTEGLVSGVFHVTGDYKMNEGSINRETFSFDLPFDITLDPRYDISTVSTDIEDFYYDVINEDTLKVNIDLFIIADYLPEEPHDEQATPEIIPLEELPKDETEEIRSSSSDSKEETEEKEMTEEQYHQETTISTLPQTPKPSKAEPVKESETREDTIDISADLFSNLDSTETYTTYYVYIVKEEDTIEKILTKYEITKEDFEAYNDINNISPGDKVIIPKQSE